MTEITISSAALVALDELQERRPASRYPADVIKELRVNGFIDDVPGGWLVIRKRGLDYLYPTVGSKPKIIPTAPAPSASSVAPTKEAPRPGERRSTKPIANHKLSDRAKEVLDRIAASGGSIALDAFKAPPNILAKLATEHLIVIDAGIIRRVNGNVPATSTPIVEQSATLLIPPADDPNMVDPPGLIPDQYDETDCGEAEYGEDYSDHPGAPVGKAELAALADVSPDCADACSTCFKARALDYLLLLRADLRTTVQHFAEYDQAKQRLDHDAEHLSTLQ